MTTIAASPLNDDLQALVDARLDTIDRMLIGRVDDQDRSAIVREVESQIFDLLGRHEGGPLDRDDVLAILTRLDPPEAYLSDDGSAVVARSARPATALQIILPSWKVSEGQYGRGSALEGVCSMVLLFIFVYLGNGGEPDVSMAFLACMLVFMASLAAIILATIDRLRSAWSIVGLVTGILSLGVVVVSAVSWLIKT